MLSSLLGLLGKRFLQSAVFPFPPFLSLFLSVAHNDLDRFLASLACGLGTSTRNQQACQLGLTSAHCSAVELFTANMTTFLSSLTTA